MQLFTFLGGLHQDGCWSWKHLISVNNTNLRSPTPSSQQELVLLAGSATFAEAGDLCMQEFLQALAIIADECGMELIDAAVQLGADPAYLQGSPNNPPPPHTISSPACTVHRVVSVQLVFLHNHV